STSWHSSDGEPATVVARGDLPYSAPVTRAPAPQKDVAVIILRQVVPHVWRIGVGPQDRRRIPRWQKAGIHRVQPYFLHHVTVETAVLQICKVADLFPIRPAVGVTIPPAAPTRVGDGLGQLVRGNLCLLIESPQICKVSIPHRIADWVGDDRVVDGI